MSQNTKIQWCQATWNPVAGCSKVSEGCRNCYAIKEAHRLASHPHTKISSVYEGLTVNRKPSAPNWSGEVRFIPERLQEPLRRKKPTRYFVNSMSDLFHEGFTDEEIDQVFAVMALAPQHQFLVLTKRPETPDGVIVSYINTDAQTKARSHYICTSRNAAQVLEHAAQRHPGRRILFLPDKYLGAVALSQTGVDRSLVDLYDGACHVHAKIGETALEQAFDRHPDAELLIHPECGCASACLSKTVSGASPYKKAYFLSTEQMLWHAQKSPGSEFIVGTEKGMLYRLRKQVPGKTF